MTSQAAGMWEVIVYLACIMGLVVLAILAVGLSFIFHDWLRLKLFGERRR